MLLLCGYPIAIAIATGITIAKTKVRPGTRGYGVGRSEQISLRLFGALGISATRRASALLSWTFFYKLHCPAVSRWLVWVGMGWYGLVWVGML